MIGISAERLTGQMLVENREVLSQEDIRQVLNEMMRRERPPQIETPQRLQVILSSIEASRDMYAIEKLRLYEMILEVVVKLCGDIAFNQQKLSAARYLSDEHKPSHAQMYSGPYQLVHTVLLEQYRVVASRHAALMIANRYVMILLTRTIAKN